MVFGDDVTSAGDVNGDGYDDVVVTVVSSDLTPGAYASLYFGSATGFPTVPVSHPDQVALAILDQDCRATQIGPCQYSLVLAGSCR